MDFLTHLSLPLAIVFLYRRDLAQSYPALLLSWFAVLPDFDKFLGMQGLFHSFVTLIPVSIGIVALEAWFRDEFQLSPVIIALLGSHLVLDFIDGGPVPLLFPFIENGLGLQYPARLTFGEGILGVVVEGPIVSFQTPSPRSGFQSFGFINGTGVMSLFVFAIIYIRQRGWSAGYFNKSTSSTETDTEISKGRNESK